MVVRIRLARFGKAHQPVYNIVVCRARTARGSKPLEVIGTYDPQPKPAIDGEGRKHKDMKLDFARAKYWLGVGAQPSEPAWKLLSMVGLLPEHYKFAEAKWRAEVVDDLSLKAQAGEITVKEYVKQVSQLKFFPGKTEAPSDMPTNDHLESEAEATELIKGRKPFSSVRGFEIGGKDEFKEFFKSTLNREPSGLLEKEI